MAVTERDHSSCHIVWSHSVVTLCCHIVVLYNGATHKWMTLGISTKKTRTTLIQNSNVNDVKHWRTARSSLKDWEQQQTDNLEERRNKCTYYLLLTCFSECISFGCWLDVNALLSTHTFFIPKSCFIFVQHNAKCCYIWDRPIHKKR